MEGGRRGGKVLNHIGEGGAGGQALENAQAQRISQQEPVSDVEPQGQKDPGGPQDPRTPLLSRPTHSF